MAARSLAGRSLAAVSLMLGFYLLALGMVALLLFIPYAEWAYAGRIHLQLGLGCIVGAGAIAWAILPRFDSFPAPGPQLHRDEHPELFARLEGISERTHQAMPKEVYLLPEMNAWVANRGGVMGFGSRRVMGIGLPLLHVTRVGEFEAILAHEFGHYHGGDTRLGPWIYKTRAAIGRTLSNLGDEGWLHLPFRWYGNFFLRITQAISRAQELTADRLAANVVGASALIGGLKKVHAYAGAFGAYWEQEAMPVLQAGFRAPLTDGFEHFLRVPRISEAIEKALDAELDGGESDPYDSHPPLRERIDAVDHLSNDSPRESTHSEETERPAIELIGEVERAETALLGHLAVDGDASRFEPLAWNDATERVFVPMWQRQAEAMAPHVGATSLGELPTFVAEQGQVLARVVLGEDVEIPEEYVPRLIGPPLGACIATSLLAAGWTACADLGETVRVAHDDAQIEPFGVVGALADPAAGEPWWQELLARTGTAKLPLCPPQASAALERSS